VQSRNIEISEPTRDRTVQLSPGVYVCVEITDTGSGIEPDLLPRVFEPFFTTKGGAHRGLGLAWVYGIVTNHGGGVAISSQPKVGTSVRVYLPATQKIVRDPGASMDDLSGHQVILIVDDEELLLNMGKMILSSFGYRVHTANSGQKALEIFSKADPPVDLVISDLVMPQMSGRELIEHLHRLSPATPVICSSGYIRPAHLEEDEAYLQKPFTSQDLLRKVKQALSPSGSD
jgi:CheY-like chemotaxis protein